MKKTFVSVGLLIVVCILFASCSADKEANARNFLSKYCSVSQEDITNYDNVSDWNNTTDEHIDKLNGKFKDFLSSDAYKTITTDDTFRKLIKNSEDEDCILKAEQIKLIEQSANDEFTEYKYKVTTAAQILGTNLTKEIKQEGILRIENTDGNKVTYLEPKKCSGF